jgi:predicted DsbA family dithiol-disulfide isomerase
MQSDRVRERIESDQARAKSLGVQTAPWLFVDKREMGSNDRNPEGVRRLLDEAVKAKSSTSEKK